MVQAGHPHAGDGRGAGGSIGVCGERSRFASQERGRKLHLSSEPLAAGEEGEEALHLVVDDHEALVHAKTRLVVDLVSAGGHG